MKNEEVNRKSFFTLRDNFIDLTIQVEKEIIRIMKENGYTELFLTHSIKTIFNDEIVNIKSIMFNELFGINDLCFLIEGKTNYYDTDAMRDINWVELLYEVLESIESGVLD